MFAATVIAALVAFAMLVMIALKRRIHRQSSIQIGVHHIGDVAGRAADQFDSGLGQRHLRTAADPAADQEINLIATQETS